MKKSISIIVIMILFTSLFCSCAKSDPITKENNTQVNYKETENITEDKISELSLGCYNKYGYYDISGQLIHYFDSETGKRIVLCNKPNCNHNNEECNAYINSEAESNDDTEYLANENAVFMMSQNDKIYILLTDGTIISMNYDGTQHKIETKIDDEYSFDRAYVNKNKIYINSYFSVQEENEIVEKACFVIYDIDNKNWEQGSVFNRNLCGDSLVGITLKEEAVYFSSDEIQEAPSGLSPNEVIQLQNKTKCRIYKTNMITGKSENIFEGTLGDCGATQVLNGTVYCYSGNQKKLYSINPDNKEKTTEFENISGEVIFDKSIDDHLVIARSTDVNSEDSIVEFFDTESKKLTKAYELESNLDWNNNFRGIIGETENQFIMVYKANFTVDDDGVDIPSVSDMKPYVGVIDKTDFWNENYNFKEVAWF